jgi:hypothetical protein
MYKFFIADGTEGGDPLFDNETELKSKLDETEQRLNAELEPDKSPEGQEASDNSEKESPTNEETPNGEETPEVTPENGQGETDKGLTLSEAEFEKLTPEQQTKFAKFKGKSIQEILDSYHNLETFVGKKQKEILQPPEQPTKQPETAEEIKKIKDNLILNGLRQKFGADFPMPPTLDTNSVEYREWIRDLRYDNDDLADKFKAAREELADEIDTDFTAIQDIRQNQDKYVDDAINSTLNGFDQYFTKELGINLKDVGIDVFQKDEDGFYTILNDLLNSPEHPENDFLDPKIVKIGQRGTPLEGVRFFDSEAAMNKLIRTYGKRAYNESIARARKEGVQAAVDKKKPEVLNSLSTARTPGIKKDNKLNLEEIDEIDSFEKKQEKLYAFMDQLESTLPRSS